LEAGKIIAAAKPRPKNKRFLMDGNDLLLRALTRPLGMTVFTRPNESPMNTFSSCPRPLPVGYRLARTLCTGLGKAQASRNEQTHNQQVTEA
jgi:hypothetical protein